MSGDRDERLAALTDRLEKGVMDLYASERYAEYLSAMSKFHHYSFGNSMLIFMQCPTATMVAGYGTWKKKFGRHVKAKETGIQIFAPCPGKRYVTQEKKDPETGETLYGADGKPLKEASITPVTRFKIATVFDVSQTEGRELPTIGTAELAGEVRDFAAIYDRLTALSPLPVTSDVIMGDAKGYISFNENRIVIRPGMSEVQTIKTLVHEIAHAKLHPPDNIFPDERKPRREKEVEAESVAYVVCQHFGIDTSEYSFGYVAGWSRGKELAELKTSLGVIQSTAQEIIDAIQPPERETEKAQHRKKQHQQR